MGKQNLFKAQNIVVHRGNVVKYDNHRSCVLNDFWISAHSDTKHTTIGQLDEFFKIWGAKIDNFSDLKRSILCVTVHICSYVHIWFSIREKGTKGRHQNYREIFYLYIVKIDGGGGKVIYLYRRIPLFPLKKGNSVVKIDWGGGQDVYLYNVKIGNSSGILMLSLTYWEIWEK